MERIILPFVAVVLVAYYLYIPIPGNIEEPWKLLLQAMQLKVAEDLVFFAELLGFNCLTGTFKFFLGFQEVPATSDENVTVIETAFNCVPVCVYIPKRKSEMLRRGLFFIHGGGFILGSAGQNRNYYMKIHPKTKYLGDILLVDHLHVVTFKLYDAEFMYDHLSRQTAHRLDAVVVSTDYGLAPKFHFPHQFEDVYNALTWFLREDTLERYGIDPGRVGVAGDSAGGNLAAAVTQQLLQDPDVKNKLKVQALVYPVLQVLDLNLPSHQKDSYFPILTKSLLVRLMSEYFTTDRTLEKAMLLNQHVPMEYNHLFHFVNWSSLLPKRYKKGHVYKNPTPGSSELAKKYPGFLDVKACPLLADDKTLSHLPLTYIITCQYDILRDDGLMYVTRLQNVGVHVTHHHIEDGFHGAFTLHDFRISHRLQNQYFSWLMKNL